MPDPRQRTGKERFIYVTTVFLDFHGDIQLSALEESLLRTLYWDKKELHILQQFGGGFGGSRVLKVQTFDANGRPLVSQVVKIGARDVTRGERVAYEEQLQGNAAQRRSDFGLRRASVTSGRRLR